MNIHNIFVIRWKKFAHTLLCLIVGGWGVGGGIANFRQPPILKDLDNFPPGAFYSPHPRSTPIIVKVCSVSYWFLGYVQLLLVNNRCSGDNDNTPVALQHLLNEHFRVVEFATLSFLYLILCFSITQGGHFIFLPSLLIFILHFLYSKPLECRQMLKNSLASFSVDKRMSGLSTASSFECYIMVASMLMMFFARQKIDTSHLAMM